MSHSKLGVVIVTYNSEGTIGPCLASLADIPADRLRIIVVDNASTDGTLDRIPQAGVHGRIDVLQSAVNDGFAAGVNRGVQLLQEDRLLTHFWLLNPDCTVEAGAVAMLLRFLDNGAGKGLTGGRVAYQIPEGRIQTDGGWLNPQTGVTHNLHQGLVARSCPPPDAGQISFVSGASLVVSRAFADRVGPMSEQYFLYYEEVDWARRKGEFPIEYCEGFTVVHQAGASIGSGAPGKLASAMSCYFLHRSRMCYLRGGGKGPGWQAYLFGVAKSLQYASKGKFSQAVEVLRGTFSLRPSRRIRSQLSADTVQILLQSGDLDYRNSAVMPSASAAN